MSHEFDTGLESRSGAAPGTDASQIIALLETRLPRGAVGQFSESEIEQARQREIQLYREEGGDPKDFNPLYGDEKNAHALEAMRQGKAFEAENADQLVASIFFGYRPAQ